MSWVVWWLELPWQFRAFVFIVLVLVCFVAPWLYNPSLPARHALRKSLSAQNDPTFAPKAEAPLRQVRPAPDAEAPRQVQPPVQTSSISGPAQVPIQALAPSATSEVKRSSGEFNIINKITNVIPIPGGGPVEKREISVSTESGSAQVDVYLLSNRANWSFGRHDRFVDTANRPIDLSALLDNGVFAKDFAVYDAVICLGLGSRSRMLSAEETQRLVESRAAHLCGLVSAKPYIAKNKSILGLPLGQQEDATAATPDKEKLQRSVIIVGIKSGGGDLANTSTQKKLISELVHRDEIADFPLSNYSEVTSGKELRYVEVKRAIHSQLTRDAFVAGARKGGLRHAGRASPLRVAEGNQPRAKVTHRKAPLRSAQTPAQVRERVRKYGLGLRVPATL